MNCPMPISTETYAAPTSLDALNALSPAQWQAILASPPAQALPWLRAAAELGHASAQAALGQWLLDGHGMAKDAEQALEWFLKSAAQGHPMGMNMAGRCLENGWGTEPDLFAAVAWYKKAASRGLDAGLYNLANQLAAGHSVPQDHAAALQLYRQAADQGHAKSMTKIGRYYEDGLVVEQDREAAFFCYQEGAQGGDFRGQFNYAGMLAERGRLAEALEWLSKVPLTATKAYLQKTGALLLQSGHAEFQRFGSLFLAHAGR
jgi:TPR repeat protein